MCVGVALLDLIMSSHSKSTRATSNNFVCETTGIDEPQFNKLNSNERIIVSLLSSKIDEINEKFSAELLKRDEKIESLQREVTILKKSYSKLEDRFDDLESSSRNNSIIVSGEEVPASKSEENCVNLVHGLIRNKLKYSISEEAICSAYRLGKPPPSQRPDKRNILVRLENENIAENLIRTSKLVRPTNLYFTENLIPKRQNILRVLRKAKKDHSAKISGCTSIRGKVYVWQKPPNPELPGARNSRILVNTRCQLEDFCANVLQQPLDNIFPNNAGLF